MLYQLEHSVKLSRRACRSCLKLAIILLIVLLFQVKLTYALPTVNVASNTNKLNQRVPEPQRYNNDKKVIEISTAELSDVGPKYDQLSHSQSEENVKINGHPKKTRFQISTVEFDRVETPMIIGLWIFFASLAKIGFHMAPKLHTMFPESCLLIVVGVVIGSLLFYITDDVKLSPLTPDTFFLYMLPPIILDAGYFMPNRLFFDHIGTILLFAVVGTIFNTLTIGASLWAIGRTGIFQCETPLLDMMLFASLISAVDPVAVLAVFEEINVNEVLYILVFGESLLNDAVTVVLYNMFEVYKELGPENIQYVDIISGFLSFFVVALGGSLIGAVWGFATGFVTKYTNEVRVIEPIFIFVMAYLAYLNAELFHMSGILATTFCGITMKNYVEANVSYKSHTTVKYTLKMLSSSSETIIFMFLGVATINKDHIWNSFFIISTIIFCSIYRALGVMLLSAIANRFRVQKLAKVEKFVLSYGGLRGAVAFALVLLIDPKIVPLQPMFVTTTITVIYFTVFIQGISIKPLVKILNVKLAEKRKPTMNERIHERVMDHIMTGIEDILGRHGNHHLRDKFKRFDNRFIRPWLLRDHKQGHEPKILETYSKLTMKDAFEFMRRNASAVGNISGTESMSAIFRSITAGNFNGSPVESSTWNIDMQELDYNFSTKDMTDAKIHHLLDEELCLPYKRYRRLSYSRHAVRDKDLTTTVNYKKHMNIRKMLSDDKRHHRRSHKKQDGKQNHVSFPEFSPSSEDTNEIGAKRINNIKSDNQNGIKDEWDGGITFTARSSICDADNSDKESDSLIQLKNHDLLSPIKKSNTETTLSWRYDNLPFDGIKTDGYQKMCKEYESLEVLPSAVEAIPPWKRDESNIYVHTFQHEFPAWASNKDYLTYNSPSATFLAGITSNSSRNQSSVIGLFRKERSESFTSDKESVNVQNDPHAVSVDNILQESNRNSLTPNSSRRIHQTNLNDISGNIIFEEEINDGNESKIRFLDSEESIDQNEDKKFQPEPD